MAESRESQHSILPSEEDLVTAKPQRLRNPLGGRSSPSLECAYLPPVFTHESFSEEVFRKVELRITNSSDMLPARGKRGSVSSAGSETTTTTTPGFLTTPRKTPAISHSHHSPANCPTRATVLQSRFSCISVTIFWRFMRRSSRESISPSQFESQYGTMSAAMDPWPRQRPICSARSLPKLSK
jgi:hypothetical protein